MRDLDPLIGEAWLTGLDCKIATGLLAGKTLGAAWREMPAEWRGTRLATCDDFPILMKFIFPRDKLSIQVHPDDAYAAEHERAAGGRGKTEMWHAVSAEPGAQVLVGLKPGADKKKFLDALNRGVLEELFLSHAVHSGDTFFIPAGIPHTIGPGMVLCEVQEYSDLTYRVYDYGRVDANGRPRELHLGKALDVTNFGSAPVGKTQALPLPAKLHERSLVAACRYFATELLQLGISQSHTTNSHFELLVILAGTGLFDGPGFAFPYRPGECWFLPADLDTYYLIAGAKFPAQGGEYQQDPTAGPTTALRTYVPDLGFLRNALLAAANSSALARTVFD